MLSTVGKSMKTEKTLFAFENVNLWDESVKTLVQRTEA